jgi:hypothetical protein
MARKCRVYSKVEEADEMIKELCEAQPEILWPVRPETIAVMGIENQERNEKNNVLAKIKPIKGSEKALLQKNNINTRYIIELYYSDWQTWTPRQRQWIIFHELLHVHPDYEKTIKHDCEDFKIMLKAVGPDWAKRDDLPDLTDKATALDKSIMPSLTVKDEEGDEIAKDEDEDEKNG